MSGRGKVAVIRDPAIAIAASKCWLARWHGGGATKVLSISIDSFHPQDCGFCEYPVERLAEALSEFAEWGNLYDRPGLSPMRAEVEMWLAMPREEQARLIAKAQGYADEDEDDDP